MITAETLDCPKTSCELERIAGRTTYEDLSATGSLVDARPASEQS